MGKITVRAAELADLETVEQLVKDAFDVRGYNPKTGAIEQNLKNDKALVLLAETAQKEAVGTMSILLDTGHLPTDQAFPGETAHLRNTSRQIAYLGSFGVPKKYWGAGMLSIGLALIREMIAWAASSDDRADTAVIVVNPRHVRFYRALGFEPVANRDNMPGLEKAPAVMMVLDSLGIQTLLARAASGSRLHRASSTIAA